MNNHTISIIVALDEHNGIGKDGGLLCHLPNDLKHFKRITTGHPILMGRRTFHSLPKGALPNRTNIVITSDDPDNYPNCLVVRSIDEAFEKCTSLKGGEECFIIGGGMLYRDAIKFADRLYITRIHHTFEDADTFFPEIDLSEWELLEKQDNESDSKHLYDYSFLKFERK